MGAGQSKVVPIHIPVKGKWVPPRKAKRRWRKNFNLLSLLCRSTSRPVPINKTKENIPSTPRLYDNEPYTVLESDIETISLASIPPSPVTISNRHPSRPHPNSQLSCNDQQDTSSLSVQSYHHSEQKKNKQKYDPFKTEGIQSTASARKSCKTSIKEPKKNKNRATRPSTVRVPKPRPREMRTSMPDRREIKPTRHTPIIHSQNTGDSYDVTVGIPGNSPVNIPGHVVDSFFSPTEVMMDELLTCFMGQQDEYPNPPRGSLLLPLGDSFDSLDSTWLSVLASADYDDSLEVGDDDGDDDDDIPMPYDYGVPLVLSRTIPGTVNDISRPRASYGTVTLPRRECWLSTSPRTGSSIRYQRSNNVAEAQVPHNQRERIIIIDEPKKKKPIKNRLLTAFRHFRRTSNRTKVTETNRELEINHGDTVQVVETSVPVEAAETSRHTCAVTARIRQAINNQPHPLSVGFQGWQ